VGVEADLALAGERRGLGHQLLGDGERRAGSEGDADHGVGRRVVEAVDRLGAGGEDGVPILGDLVGRQAALRAAEVHRAAAGMEADVQLARGLDLHCEQVAGVAGEHVVVIGAGAAARAQEGGEARAGGGALDVGVDPSPGRVQLLQPLEQRRLLGEPAGGPLVEVVVAVDEAGGGEAAASVDAAAVGVRRTFAHGFDPPVRDHDVAVGVLRARGVDGGDRAVLEDQSLSHRATARRTASRTFS
jgi:hypothetical protein